MPVSWLQCKSFLAHCWIPCLSRGFNINPSWLIIRYRARLNIRRTCLAMLYANVTLRIELPSLLNSTNQSHCNSFIKWRCFPYYIFVLAFARSSGCRKTKDKNPTILLFDVDRWQLQHPVRYRVSQMTRSTTLNKKGRVRFIYLFHIF